MTKKCLPESARRKNICFAVGFSRGLGWWAATRLVCWLLGVGGSLLLAGCGQRAEPLVVTGIPEYDRLLDSLRRLPPDPRVLMQVAIDGGDVARVDSLLRRGVDVNAALYTRLGKLNLLGRAVEQDQAAVVHLLLARGAAVNQRGPYPATPLCLAKSPAVFRLLMTHGARLERLSFSEGTQEWTYPTTYLRQHSAVAPLVLDYAPDSLYRQYDFYEPLLLGFLDRDDTTRVRQLVRKGASLVKPMRAGVKYKILVSRQPLYYSRSLEMTWLLARNGAAISHISDEPTYDYNLLAMAIGYGDVSLLRYAEQRGQHLHTPGNPFFLDARHPAMVRYLLRRGVSINSRDSYGNTSLLRAAFSTHDACLEHLLLQLGADKTLVNNGGDCYQRGYNPRTGRRPLAAADTISYYACVEQMPTLPGGGGLPAIQAYVQRALALCLPADVRSGLVKGRTDVQLTVGPSGVVRNPEATAGHDTTGHAAVLAAVRQLPRLVPGRHQGRPVSVQLWLKLSLAAPRRSAEE